ncbi:hypothetical protein BM1374166_01556 [Bartonella tribocorum]|nr:hypothetical protein BM1374166_01556 [Bartonella tribocorum]
MGSIFKAGIKRYFEKKPLFVIYFETILKIIFSDTSLKVMKNLDIMQNKMNILYLWWRYSGESGKKSSVSNNGLSLSRKRERRAHSTPC